ncbi:hypothetical protein GCM10027161_50250 [Microbispora hainanensis]
MLSDHPAMVNPDHHGPPDDHVRVDERSEPYGIDGNRHRDAAESGDKARDRDEAVGRDQDPTVYEVEVLKDEFEGVHAAPDGYGVAVPVGAETFFQPSRLGATTK